MIRVLVTDDSAFMRRVIKEMIDSDPMLEVVGVARNGREGLDMAKSLKPDVITLDIEMPDMDGLTALRFIMREAPTQVLMLSSLTTKGSVESLQALKLGAADVLAKDASNFSANIMKIKGDLLTRVKALGRSKRHLPAAPVTISATDKPSVPKAATFRPGQFDLVCIGSSTGGPPVLESLITQLPKTFTSPIVISQHMPQLFTKSMADRLNETSQLNVVHAETGMRIDKGHVYIAPGGAHLHLKREGLTRHSLVVSDEPLEAVFKPSVNVLFETAAQCTGRRTLGIVLTGIGDDGCEGAKVLHEKGATILAQDEATSVVYGMPKAVAQANIDATILSPQQILQTLISLSRAGQAAA